MIVVGLIIRAQIIYNNKLYHKKKFIYLYINNKFYSTNVYLLAFLFKILSVLIIGEGLLCLAKLYF